MNKYEALELWEKLNNLNWNAEMVQNEVNAGICKLHETLTGKKCRDANKARDKLVKKGFQAELENFLFARYDEFNANKKSIESELIKWAKENPNMPYSGQEMTMIKKAYGGDWRSQGSGANKYARNSLMESYNLLKMLGYTVEIRAVDGCVSGENYSQYYENYELWANISEFDFWCLNHSDKFISVLNWCVILWRNGSNPKVHFPFLSDEDYDKSQYLAYSTNYEITKENMMLELSWEDIYKLDIK